MLLYVLLLLPFNAASVRPVDLLYPATGPNGGVAAKPAKAR
ncbi:predicted protein [Plenodomus lingam JN3]|uniref:Uncharacterized protein n=1 Tax=Leptosphaeria maculans (strain JN3 / isolate v23.1.3 / race Av1-4-5-6-7-8) TaxID=985895 RepID=E4ZGC7_LEPMJ|nr:predicted protein [Plenodomus lingam JN3]CBX90347.1 predicted protein [Plenodomus lingam JN3]